MPYQLLIGHTPKIHVPSRVESLVPGGEERAEHLKQLQECAQEAIRRAQKMVIMQAEWQRKGTAFKPFTEGEQVWLEDTNLQLSHPTAKLAARHYGPFKVLKVLSPMAYKLEIPKD